MVRLSLCTNVHDMGNKIVTVMAKIKLLWTWTQTTGNRYYLGQECQTWTDVCMCTCIFEIIRSARKKIYIPKKKPQDRIHWTTLDLIAANGHIHSHKKDLKLWSLDIEKKRLHIINHRRPKLTSCTWWL